MSPFLAQVQVINVAGDARSSATAASSATQDDYDASLKELRSNVEKIKANAQAKAAAAVEKARRETAQELKEQSEDKDDDEDRTTSHPGGTASVIVQTDSPKHHSKSSGNEDTVVAAIPIVAIVFTFIYLIIRALMAPFTARSKRGAQPPVVMEGMTAEEIALLEKLQRTLVQMESRVESLETILIDPARNKEKYGTKL